MARLLALIAALVGAAVVALLAARPPPALPAYAPAGQFSAAQAFLDIREIARRPHPTGTPDSRRVRAYLVQRLQALGMETAERPLTLTPAGLARLRRWGGGDPAMSQPANIVGVLPGRDRAGPAVLLMAHYDTVWGSPGAADDSAGVAAALEVVRVLKQGPPPARDVVILFTDAEELNSDGARAFFGADPLAGRIGTVVNLEARGSGGRAVMFETGPDNGAMVRLFAGAVRQPTAQSLAVYIYRIMPNFTDFSIAKAKGIAGFNLAFMGRAGLYHSPLAIPETVQPGAVQHIGSQALDIVRALATAPALPPRAPDAAFSDFLGLGVLAYPAWAGWIVLAAAGCLLAFAGERARAANRFAWAEAGQGALAALSLSLHCALALQVLNRLSGSGAGANPYDRLAALPGLEIQAGLIAAAVVLAVLNPRRWAHPVGAVGPALLLMLASAGLGGISPVTAGLGLASALAAFASARRPVGVWGGWIGAAGLVLALALAAQVAAPTTPPLLAWPLLLAAAGAAACSIFDPDLRRPAPLALLAVIAAAAGGWVLSLAHLAFLGVGADLPEIGTVFALLLALLIEPLLRDAFSPRVAAAAATLLLLAAAGQALVVRTAPLSPTVPVYSR